MTLKEVRLDVATGLVGANTATLQPGRMSESLVPTVLLRSES